MRRFLLVAAVAVVALLALAAMWLFGPFGDPDLSASPRPARSYEEAATRIGTIERREARGPISERGRSYAMLHGERTAKSVVLFHGYTSNPRAFKVLAQGFFDAGYNVWVPRAPLHGYDDLMTDAHANITAEQLRDYADSAVDVAAGLGDQVVVAGQSGGGMLSMWALAERPEVVRAVAVSPFLHPKEGLPLWQMRPIGRLSSLGLLRGMWKWWDPVLMDSPKRQLIDPNPYPRGSVNALAQYLTVGRWLKDTRSKQPAPDGALVLVVNEHDPDIDAPYNVALARKLGREGRVAVVVIPDAEGLGHDLVDPEGTNRAKIRGAYRYLADALGIELPDPRAGN